MELTSSYKRTEIGLIPVEWAVMPLKKISPKQSVGLVINPSSYFDDYGTVPMLVGSNIDKNKIRWESAKRISNESNKRISASRLMAGDLVTVRVGDPGITAVVPPELDGCNCASVMIVRQHNRFDSHWLCYLMNSQMGLAQVGDVQYGTAQKQFNISDAVNFVYPVPPLSEQKAIAEALSDADALIESLEQLLAKKRHIKQGTMQELLTGKKRLPGFDREWIEGVLGDVVERLEAGVSVNSSEQEPSSDTSCVLKTSALFNGAFRPHESKVIASSDHHRAKLNPLRDTILISRMNTPDLVGEIAYVDKDYPWLFLPDRIWITRFRSRCTCSTRWLAYLLSSQRYRTDIKDLATGTSGSMKNISKDAILSLSILFPSEAEQTAIATILSDMDAEVAALEAKLTKARQIKEGMMQELLTGRIRLV
jgi:type I restriction enzyme S subunit